MTSLVKGIFCHSKVCSLGSAVDTDSIKPAEHPSNRDWRLGIAAIGIDQWLHVKSFDDVLVVLGAKVGIQRWQQSQRSMPI